MQEYQNDGKRGQHIKYNKIFIYPDGKNMKGIIKTTKSIVMENIDGWSIGDKTKDKFINERFRVILFYQKK
ncbi:unnamed protein product [Paramecium octaurelia]|uniref:Uncharacterized protein n=1 Tax=Paramecium octaurelia TaxID=43137 RepID=A0A8S1SZF7_PAROT|nr:unnamed protein product [Paramecium octaurelia]